MPMLRDLFMLDPNIVFLNHGSFGACPRAVFEIYQNWQRELERQPVEFLGRRADILLNEARETLGQYINVDSDDLLFVPNATIGINTVARSLQLAPGDEVLTTDHEYGAVDYTWQHVCKKSGAHYVNRHIPMPVESPEAFVNHFWEGVTPNTKVIAMSHITSPTALIFPIKEICHRAREAGIITVIDGAHAPGQIPLDLERIDPDFYAGNCHKWLCAPKGSGFLYARKDRQPLIEPLIISWGYGRENSFVTQNQWQGTRDIAAFLSVPGAISFEQELNWDQVRWECHTLAATTRKRISALTGLPQIAPQTWFVQMFTVPIPTDDIFGFTKQLYDKYKIEVPAIEWHGNNYIRVSIQGYNTHADADALIFALEELLGS